MIRPNTGSDEVLEHQVKRGAIYRSLVVDAEVDLVERRGLSTSECVSGSRPSFHTLSMHQYGLLLVRCAQESAHSHCLCE